MCKEQLTLCTPCQQSDGGPHVLCSAYASSACFPGDQMGQGSRFHPLRAVSELGYDEMSACLCCLACEGRISTPIFNVMISNPLGFDPEIHPEAFCSGKNTLSITPLKGRTATSPLRRGLLRPASSFLLPPRGSHSAPHCGHPSWERATPLVWSMSPAATCLRVS